MNLDQPRKYPDDENRPLDPEFADFDRIYYRYAARLVVYARRFVDGKYAEDVVQDVFMRCWQQGHFRLPEAQLQPLLYRSVLNACRNLIRHNLVADKYARNSLEKIQLGEVEYELRILDEQHDDLTDRLHGLIDSLPERCREVFLLSWFENLRSDEIAERLRISRRTVDTQLYKALQFLRRRMLLLVGAIGALFCTFF
ncbi:RNA polymerase sigma-70 factor [Alistipes sp. An116]|uniref:RNA polymerase sigma-70 factor n=1 Tax=Alistipes sp. An116 TaxID=1965546 RepID=UPI0013A63B0B|nr:RNA polymerase sigma-70 factor [Alistipes sp. An116]